jgi:hypothetical protein
MDEAALLQCGLFEGDRDSDVTIFSNKMVTTRAEHKCVICWSTIPRKTRVRAQTERNNDDHVVMTFYVCPECGEALCVAYTEADEQGERLEARYALGIETARAA